MSCAIYIFFFVFSRLYLEIFVLNFASYLLALIHICFGFIEDVIVIDRVDVDRAINRFLSKRVELIE